MEPKFFDESLEHHGYGYGHERTEKSESRAQHRVTIRITTAGCSDVVSLMISGVMR